jgi:hypothetical protein
MTPIVNQIDRYLNACARFLDYSGRLQLVNCVLSSLPNHYLSSRRSSKLLITREDTVYGPNKKTPPQFTHLQLRRLYADLNVMVVLVLLILKFKTRHFFSNSSTSSIAKQIHVGSNSFGLCILKILPLTLNHAVVFAGGVTCSVWLIITGALLHAELEVVKQSILEGLLAW